MENGDATTDTSHCAVGYASKASESLPHPGLLHVVITPYLAIASAARSPTQEGNRARDTWPVPTWSDCTQPSEVPAGRPSERRRRRALARAAAGSAFFATRPEWLFPVRRSKGCRGQRDGK